MPNEQINQGTKNNETIIGPLYGRINADDVNGRWLRLHIHHDEKQQGEFKLKLEELVMPETGQLKVIFLTQSQDPLNLYAWESGEYVLYHYNANPTALYRIPYWGKSEAPLAAQYDSSKKAWISVSLDRLEKTKGFDVRSYFQGVEEALANSKLQQQLAAQCERIENANTEVSPPIVTISQSISLPDLLPLPSGQKEGEII